MTTVGILVQGPRAWASSRLRGYWLADADPVHIKVYGPGEALVGIDRCDAVVFQKLHDPQNVERARRYRAEGRRVIFDVCDPVWWFDAAGVADMFKAAHVVTTSSPAMAAAVEAIGIARQVVCIPDRMLPSFHPTWRQHAERERVVFVWYGASQNRIALEGYLPLLGYLARNIPLELRILDDAPGAKVVQQEMPHFTIRNVPFALETYHAQLLDADIAYLPAYPGPWGLLKSNNRQVTAWWAGLPVVDGMDLERMAALAESAEERQIEAVGSRKVAEAHYSVHQSVSELLALVERTKAEPVRANGHKEVAA